MCIMPPMEPTREPATEQSYKERILRVLVHIQHHLDEAVRLEDLARVAHFSPYHFHRIFRGMIGESVMDHVRRLRLERAAHRLKFGDQPVTRVAFDAGYETHEAFSRAFKSMFDETPSGFRATHRKIPWKPVPSGVHFSADADPQDFTPAIPGATPMEVQIKNVDAITVAFVRHIGPYDQVGTSWNRLMAWASGQGFLGPKMKMLGIVHDDPEVTPPEKIRYDACLEVRDGFEPTGEIGVQQIDAGDYAVTTHQGPYAGLGDTYARLCGEWLPTSGRQIRSAPPFEIYRNSPIDTAPESLLTEIHLPLD